MSQDVIVPLPTQHTYSVPQMAELAWADAERRQDARDAGKPLGPTTGLPALDDLLAGCMEPGLYTLNGVPGMGKTALALSIAADCGCPAVFLSCEMAPLELFRRLVARAARRSMYDLRTAPASFVMQAVAEAREKINPDLVILDGTTTRWGVAELRRITLLLLGESKNGMLVVDSLHAWAQSVAPETVTEYDALNQAVGFTRKLAQDYGIPVLQVAERNRASMVAGGLHSSAGSRRIEYASDVYIDLSKPEDQPPAVPGFTPMKRVLATLEKNRFGMAGSKVSLLFDGPHQRFTEEA